MSKLLSSPQAQFLPFFQLQPLMKASSELGFLASENIQHFPTAYSPVFLGLMTEVPYFAIDLSDQPDPLAVLSLHDGWAFEDSYIAATRLPAYQAGLLAQARSRIGWHANHQFCAVCAHQTKPTRGGQQRVCEHCGAQHFPRTDPVVIMLISQDNRCLLGQPHGPLVQRGIWSALAGFIEQGESIEEAVRREVKEESGVQVGAVEYHSSQPWPFPSSLMIGCLGEALSEEIRVDHNEMHDVRWFDRDDIRSALEGDQSKLIVPGPIAIAHHLIKAWAWA